MKTIGIVLEQLRVAQFFWFGKKHFILRVLYRCENFYVVYCSRLISAHVKKDLFPLPHLIRDVIRCIKVLKFSPFPFRTRRSLRRYNERLLQAFLIIAQEYFKIKKHKNNTKNWNYTFLLNLFLKRKKNNKRVPIRIPNVTMGMEFQKNPVSQVTSQNEQKKRAQPWTRN